MARPHNRLQALRTLRGLSTRKLGDMIGKPQSAISRIENGQQSLTIDLMYPLADALGVRPSDLLEDDRPSPYALMRGSLDDGGKIYGEDQNYFVPVPYPRPPDRMLVVFEQPSRDRHYIAEQQLIPTPEDRDHPFIVSFEVGGGDVYKVELRTYEIIGSTGGFSGKTGDPTLRWLRFADERVINSWRVVGEYRWRIHPERIRPT